jgi:hypothetical protein
MAADQKLRGAIRPGMFPSEVTFVVAAHNGTDFVVFIPKEMVEEAHGVHTIKVRVVDRAAGIALVRVPGEPLDSSMVSVAASELSPA